MRSGSAAICFSGGFGVCEPSNVVQAGQLHLEAAAPRVHQPLEADKLAENPSRGRQGDDQPALEDLHVACSGTQLLPINGETDEAPG